MKDFKFRVWDSVRMSYDPPNYPDYVLSTEGKVYRGVLDIPPHLAIKFMTDKEGIPYLEDENELLVLSAVQLSDCEIVDNIHSKEDHDFFHGKENK